jgi:hypothetical protein
MHWFQTIDWKLGPLAEHQFQPWKIIILTRGQFAVVDRADYEWLSQWKWCAKWAPCTKSYYAIRGVRLGKKIKTVLMHREINKPAKGQHVDHVNHATTDNRRENLENMSPRMNAQKQKRKPKTSCPKFVGVGWHRQAKKWRAKIGCNGKTVHLGLFTHPADAAAAYNFYIIKHNLPATLNEIPQPAGELCVG